MTHKGIPDYQRAARCILKDFVNVCMAYAFTIIIPVIVV